MKKLIYSNPVGSFIVITLLYSWTLWLLMILSSKDLLPFRFPTNFLGSFGPAVGALAVTGFIEGKSGIKKILRSIIRWRSSSWSYMFSILFIIVVYTISIIISYFLDREIVNFQKLPGIAEVILYFIVIAILGGPLGEEIGWRGFLQPELLKRFSPVVTSILIATIWLIWHIPLFWLEGAAQEGGSIFFFAISVFAMAFLFTLLYIRSDGSLLLAILFHTMINYVSAFIVPAILPATEADKMFGRLSAVVLFASAIILIAVYRRFFRVQKAFH